MKRQIPNAITLLGAFCALLSIVWAPVHPYWACHALIAAALFDMIDGRIARVLDAQTALGEQLDGLVDIVAFGVAPTWLLHVVALESAGHVGAVPVDVGIMFAFVACSALRLARFNQQDGEDRANFRGVPTPVAALILVTAVMTGLETSWPLFARPAFLAALALALSLLMVAPLPFPSYKAFRTRLGRIAYFGSIAGGLTMLFLGLPGGTVLFGILSLYVLRGLFFALVR